MAIQNGYRKKLDFNNDEWEEVQPQNKKIDFNTEEWENIEYEQLKQKPQIQKDIEGFGTGGINMLGLRAPITGVMSGIGGLIGKAFGNNDKSFYENYQDGYDFVRNQEIEAENNSPTAYGVGKLAANTVLGTALAKGLSKPIISKIPSETLGAIKSGGNEILKSTLSNIKSNEIDMLKSTLKNIATGNTATNYAKYKIADVLFNKFFGGGK